MRRHLGHASVSSTQVYADVLPEDVQAGVDRAWRLRQGRDDVLNAANYLRSEGMDWVITAFRVPLAFVAFCCIAGFWAALFVCETAAVLVMLPIAVVAFSRAELKASFVARYPNSAPMANMGTAANRLYSWAVLPAGDGGERIGKNLPARRDENKDVTTG